MELNTEFIDSLVTKLDRLLLAYTRSKSNGSNMSIRELAAAQEAVYKDVKLLKDAGYGEVKQPLPTQVNFFDAVDGK
jgi:hypothetical protein